MAEYEVFSSGSISDSLAPCNVCGRTFMPETLVKHERICAKASTKSRKVFQSGRQRADGSDVPINNVLKSGAPAEKARSNAEPTGKKSNWRTQHEQFIQGLKAARGVQAAIASGKPLPPPPPPTINPDYVQCPSCSRRFNETAAERHIPFCKEKNKRIPDKKTVDPTAQRRMDARLNFKTAKPRIKGREDSMYHAGGNGLDVNGYSAPMRTGRNTEGDNLNIRSGSLDRRKGSGDGKPNMRNKRINSHETLSAVENGRYSPSPPGAGRPPSGSSYQHRSREGSSRSGYSSTSSRAYDSGVGSLEMPANQRGRRHTNNYAQKPSSGSKFCGECGNKFCRMDSKFCCECGVQR